MSTQTQQQTQPSAKPVVVALVFNKTQLQELDSILQIAHDYFERPTGLPLESHYLERINHYRKLLTAELANLQ
jgi:hypothetical protein